MQATKVTKFPYASDIFSKFLKQYANLESDIT